MRFPVCCPHPDPCLPELTRPNPNPCGHSSTNCSSYCCQPPSNSRSIYHQQQHGCPHQQQHNCKQQQQQYACPQLCRHQPSCQQIWQQAPMNSQTPCFHGHFNHPYPHSHEQSLAIGKCSNSVNNCHCQYKSSDVIIPQHRTRSVSSQSLPSSGSCDHTLIRHSGSADHVGASLSNSSFTHCRQGCGIPDKNRKNTLHDAAITNLSHQMEHGLNCDNPAENERDLLAEQAVASSGWYYGKLSWREAEVKLRDSKVGCFLLRDSSDPRYSYSLSVQTPRGPTSVRIQRDTHGFSLDSDPGSDPLVFTTIHELLQHYITLTSAQEQQPDPYTRSATVSREHVWLDSNGSVVAAITLTVPLRRRPASLQHLARLRVNRDLALQDVCSLPTNLQGYLEQYPFWC